MTSYSTVEELLSACSSLRYPFSGVASMENSNGPGIGLMLGTFLLFGALVAVAWHEDAAREAELLKKPTASTCVIGSPLSCMSK